MLSNRISSQVSIYTKQMWILNSYVVNHDSSVDVYQALTIDMENKAATSEETAFDEIKSFFDSAPPLKDGDGIVKKLNGFLEKNSLPTSNHFVKYIYL